jgi:hypothetical protein
VSRLKNRDRPWPVGPCGLGAAAQSSIGTHPITVEISSSVSYTVDKCIQPQRYRKEKWTSGAVSMRYSEHGQNGQASAECPRSAPHQQEHPTEFGNCNADPIHCTHMKDLTGIGMGLHGAILLLFSLCPSFSHHRQPHGACRHLSRGGVRGRIQQSLCAQWACRFGRWWARISLASQCHSQISASLDFGLT